MPQLMRGRACPAVTTSGPALPPATGRLSFVHTSSLQPNSGASSPRSCSRARSSLPLLQGQLHCAVQKGCRPHSPEWVSPPACRWGGGVKGVGHLSLIHATIWQTRGSGPALPLSCPQGQLTCTPMNSSIVVAQVRCRSCFPQ